MGKSTLTITAFFSNRQAVFTGLLAFLVYLITLSPDLTWANYGVDGGELITASMTLGVPHPSGYPTYILLGKLFSFLPISSIAYRFNLFSAGSMATAAGFITAISSKQYKVTENRTALSVNQRLPIIAYGALFTGLAFAFAPLAWGQAIITEVYGLNLAFLAAFLWALLGKRPSLPTGILLGLSITTHLTSTLMLPLALLLTPRRQWPQLGLGIALGLSPWLALPWLAQGNSPIIWGNPTTVRGWLWLISGQLYHPNLFTIGSSELMTRLRDWGQILLNQFTWAGLPLIIFAFYRAKGSLLRLRLGLLGTAVLYLMYAFSYASSDAIIFTLPALLLLSLLLAPGLQRLGWLALLLPLTSLLLNYGMMDLSGDDTVRPLAEQLLHQAPPDAVLLTPGDETIFTLWYYHHVERQRPDLILADANLFAFDWYRERLRQRHADLFVPKVDDLDSFQQSNQQERPFCTAIIQPANGRQLDCSQNE